MLIYIILFIRVLFYNLINRFNLNESKANVVIVVSVYYIYKYLFMYLKKKS